MIDVISNLLTQQELQILGMATIIFVSTNVIIYALFILFLKIDDGIVKRKLREIIYRFDEFADKMENGEKRLLAINKINQLLGWRRIVIPSFLIGFIIDAEVAAIRKMQLSTNTPDLHKEGE